MAVQGWRCWASLLLVLLTSSFSISDASTIRTEEEVYNESSMTEVMEIPSSGTTRVCVVPLVSNTRLKVQHTDTEGGTQEAVVRKKLLAENELSILEIEVQPSGDSKPGLSVRLNGTQLPIQPSSNPETQQPRTALLFKGQARIKLCPAAPEARGAVVPQDEEKQATTQEQGEGEQTATQGKGEKMTTSSASLLPPSPTNAPSNSTSEGTESGEEDPWWSFLLVLGTVGEVPVLALLVGGVLLGALMGGIVVCCCTRGCGKCCRKYERVPTHPRTELKTQPKPPFVATNDFIRNTSLDRSSGIGSASSTLTHDAGHNSVDRSIKSTTHPSVNNLGRGTTGSPSGSTGRSHNNTLNIPTSASMTRYGSHRSTGSSDNRDPESNRTRTASSRSTGSSVNRNTNRSPNIPYTKTLGAITGHQDPAVIMKHRSGHSVGSVDSFTDDDENYDKPYVSVSRPIVAENYSVPHAEVITLERPTNTNTTGNISADRQVSPQYATFGK